MDESARQEKRVKHAAYKAERRAGQNDTQRDERLAKQKAIQAKARADESEAQHQERLAKQRAIQAKALAGESDLVWHSVHLNLGRIDMGESWFWFEWSES